MVALFVAVTGCYEMKEAGRHIGHTAKNVGTDIGHGSRDTAHAVGRGVKRVTKAIVSDTGK
jgi:hypothetical protein